MTVTCPHCFRSTHSPVAAFDEEVRCRVCGLVFRAEPPKVIAIQDDNPPAVAVRVSILQGTRGPEMQASSGPAFPA